MTSTGRKAELEKLQGVQGAAARWILQTRKRDWSLTGGLKKLGWLSLAQLAAYSSLKLAIRVLRDKTPERLYKLLTQEEGDGRVRRRISDSALKKMKATTRKAWSVRVLRWMELMPGEIKEMDMTRKHAKKELKKWIKHVIPVRGDRVLWGQPLTGDQRRKRARENPGPPHQGGGGPEEDRRPGEQGTGPKGLPGPQPVVAAAIQQEYRETVATQGTAQDLQQERRICWQGQARRFPEGSKRVWNKKRWNDRTELQGLPCSLAAVVMTSPKESRETGTTEARQPGEGGEGIETGAARIPPQAHPEGEVWLRQRKALVVQCCARGMKRQCCKGVKRMSWIGSLAKGWTTGSLCWRKGVG